MKINRQKDNGIRNRTIGRQSYTINVGSNKQNQNNKLNKSAHKQTTSVKKDNNPQLIKQQLIKNDKNSTNKVLSGEIITQDMKKMATIGLNNRKDDQNKKQKGIFDFIFDIFKSSQPQIQKIKRQDQIKKQQEQNLVNINSSVKLSKKLQNTKQFLQAFRNNSENLDHSRQSPLKSQKKQIKRGQRAKKKLVSQPYNLNMDKFQKISDKKQQVFKSRPKVQNTPRKNNYTQNDQDKDQKQQVLKRLNKKKIKTQQTIQPAQKKQVRFSDEHLLLPKIVPKPIVQYSSIKPHDILANIRQTISYQKGISQNQSFALQFQYKSILLKQKTRGDTQPSNCKKSTTQISTKNYNSIGKYTQSLRPLPSALMKRYKYSGFKQKQT